ncbi:PA0069 family radical SAM protein [bacterium]|nr:PA0069 family radical SAM protein [bacterium]
MPEKPAYLKGKGAQTESANRFLQHRYVDEDTGAVHAEPAKPTATAVFPKTVLNRITSPDVPDAWGLNPYQGCEHGCSYCYARPTHEYWGYGPGLDFEQKLLYKSEAAQLLRQHFEAKNWTPDVVLLSGNTDCYQPLERTLRLTRSLLEVFVEYRNPLRIITKNALVTRDIDLLSTLAAQQLVQVTLSITTLDERLRQKLEPRTSTAAKRLEAVRLLSDAGIPVEVLMAPVIPGLNDSEIFSIAQAAASAGARFFGHTVLRLSKPVRGLFEDWLRKAFPDRAEKVLHLLYSVHDGKTHSSEFGVRMKGKGSLADSWTQQMAIARKKHGLEARASILRTDLFCSKKGKQLHLWPEDSKG